MSLCMQDVKLLHSIAVSVSEYASELLKYLAKADEAGDADEQT